MQKLTDEQLRNIISDTETIAVVGASNKEDRASNGIMKFLMKSGYKCYPVNPVEETVLGEQTHDSLAELPEQVDIVNVFRRSEFAADIVREAVGKNPKLIWLQEGVESKEAEKIAEYAGVPIIMDKCIYKEMMRLGLM